MALYPSTVHTVIHPRHQARETSRLAREHEEIERSYRPSAREWFQLRNEQRKRAAAGKPRRKAVK